MKLSGKILLIAGILLLGFIIYIVASARMIVGNIVTIEKGNEGSAYTGKMIEDEFDYDGFSEVTISGLWHVEIEQGDEYLVQVEYPEEAEDSIEVSANTNRLNLTIEGKIRLYEGKSIKASIQVPDLTALAIKGGSKVELKELNLSGLDIDVEGASSIEGTDCRVDRLSLHCEGAVNLDFSESETVNADIDLAGASNVMLNMDGGYLRGSIEGVGSVSYSGPVSEERIEKDGLASVTKQ